MRKSTGTIIGVAGAVVVVGAFFAGVVIFDGRDSGKPKADASTAKKQNVQVAPDLVNDSDVLHVTVDDFVGYGGYDALAAGRNDMWFRYTSEYRAKMVNDIQHVENDVQLAKNTIPKAQDILKDLTMLNDLLAVADKHHDQTGADALRYYHRVAEDIHYYLTGEGEEFGVSHVEGGTQTVLDFLHSQGFSAE